MTARVARRRNCEQIAREWHRILPRQTSFNNERAAHIIAVHHPFRPEMLCPGVVVGHIVTVGEKQELYPPKSRNALRKRARKARRIHKHIPFRTDDQIAGGAVGRLRSKAAKADLPLDPFRIGFGCFFEFFLGFFVSRIAVGQVTRALSAESCSAEAPGW